jgi:hypothetical protein
MSLSRMRVWTGLAAVVLWVHVAPAATQPVSPRVEFNRDVRPILSDTCFKCHGRDANARQAELRLDVREEAIKPHEGDHPFTPIVPGDPSKSEAWRRISASDPDELMPPVDSHLALTDKQKVTIRRWIEQGAEYQPHWAFLPVTEPKLSEVKTPAWPRNAIDNFVLAKLESEGLEPAPEADRR